MIRLGFFLVSTLFNIVGMVAVCIFNWRVFRPRESGPPGSLRVCVCACSGPRPSAYRAGSGVAALPNEGTGYLVFTTLQGVPLGWAAFNPFATTGFWPSERTGACGSDCR